MAGQTLVNDAIAARDLGRYTGAIQSMLAKAGEDAQLRITGEHGLLVLLLALTFLIRVLNLTFNTLHLDEAIYATVGEEALAGVFTQGASSWMFGSYMYPLAASLADHLAGVVGMRLLSAILITIAAVFVYLTADRLFGRRSALWGLFIFGLTGVSINLGQHASVDALGVPLLAAALYCGISAIQVPERANGYLQWAGALFGLSVIAKYIAFGLFPALILLMFALHIARGRSLWSFFTRYPWQVFMVPMLIILGIYGAFYAKDLQAVFSGAFSSQYQDRFSILRMIVGDIGLPLVLALIGGLIAGWEAMKRLQHRSMGMLILLAGLLPALTLALLALPIYHFASSNVRSLWKHDVYTLAFAAPIAGYAIARIIAALRSTERERDLRFRLLGAAVTAVAVFLFVNGAFRQNQEFHSSWPNNQEVIDFLRTQNITPQSRILSSSYAIYEYYFDFGVEDRSMWNNIWYTEYNGLQGLEAVERGVQECAFDLIVLERYYEPAGASSLESMAANAGYTVTFTDSDMLSNGAVMVAQVYARPEGASCGGGNAP